MVGFGLMVLSLVCWAVGRMYEERLRDLDQRVACLEMKDRADALKAAGKK